MYCGFMKRKKIGLKGLICLDCGLLSWNDLEGCPLLTFSIQTLQRRPTRWVQQNTLFLSSFFLFLRIPELLDRAPSSHERSFFNNISHKRSFLFLHTTYMVQWLRQDYSLWINVNTVPVNVAIFVYVKDQFTN